MDWAIDAAQDRALPVIWSKLFPKRGAQTAIVKAREELRHESKSIGVVWPAEFFDLPGNPTRDPLARSIGKRNAYGVVALVFACMDYRSTKLSEAPLWIVDDTDDGEVWLKGEHVLSSLLEQPNPDMSMADLLQLLSLYDDATGGWLLVKNRDRAGRVGALYPYAFDQFSVEPADGRLYGKFRLQTLAGGYETKGPDDVIFFKRPSLGSILSATSRIDAALAHINIGDQMRVTISQLLKRAIRPSAITQVPGNYTDDQATRLKADFRALYAGYLNAGENIIVEGGGELALLNQGMKDLELGPVQQDVEAAICQVFQVHPGVVAARLGVENSSGFADLVDSATKLTYDIATIPTWSRYANAFTRGLLREVDPDPRRFLKFDTTNVRALARDMTAAVGEAKQATGFWTIDEQRAHTDKPALPNGEGEELSKPAGPANPNPDDPNADPNAKPNGKKAFDARAIRVVTGAALAGLSLSAAWQDFDQKAASHESRYEQAAVAQFDRESDRVVEIVEQSVPSQKADESEAERIRRLATAALLAPYLEVALLRIAAQYSENGVFRREWVTTFTPLVRQTLADGARDVAGAIGIEFNLQNPRVKAIIQQRVTKLAGAVTDTSLQRVRDVITEARDAGVGISEITKRIRDDAFGGDVTTSRAKRIARTETIGALNEGEHLAAIESGVMQSKHWLDQKDSKVRPSHRANSAQGWIPIGDRYQNGLDHPHEQGAPAEEVIECRCGQLFSDQTADEANRG